MNVSGADREGVFIALLEQHMKISYKVARAYCHSANDREDLIAEMTAALWKSFGRYDERYRFSTWMYRIVLNVAISFYRSAKRRTEHSTTVDPASLECAAIDSEPDDRVARLNEFVAKLGDLDKAMMLLYLESYGYAEIAVILGLTRTNVATKLGRVKQKARAALERDDTLHEGEQRGTR